jgi:TM2 domain-containing membrane protein YozV
MKERKIAKPGNRVIAFILSFLVCGLGQIYLRRIARGVVLFLTFSLAAGILLLALYGSEVKVSNWGENSLMFNPARSVTFLGQTFYLNKMMKITGSIQLVFAWGFGIVDALHRRRWEKRYIETIR